MKSIYINPIAGSFKENRGKAQTDCAANPCNTRVSMSVKQFSAEQVVSSPEGVNLRMSQTGL